MNGFYNEMGEPLLSPEGMRAEMNAQHDPMDMYCNDCGVCHGGDCDTGCEECGDYRWPYLDWYSSDGSNTKVCKTCYEEMLACREPQRDNGFSVWYVGNPSDPHADCLFTTRLPEAIAQQVADALRCDFGYRTWIKKD